MEGTGSKGVAPVEGIEGIGTGGGTHSTETVGRLTLVTGCLAMPLAEVVAAAAAERLLPVGVELRTLSREDRLE